MEAQAREILALGARNVLIKGGHGEGDESVDLLIGAGRGRAPFRQAHRHAETRTAPAARCRRPSPPASPRAAISSPRRRTPRPTSPRPSPPPIACRSATGHGPLHHFYATMEHVMTTRRKFHHRRGRAPPPALVAAPAVARAQHAEMAHGHLLAEAAAGPGHVGRAHRRRASARCRAAASTSPCMRRAKWCRPSRCSTRSATASPTSATPPRSTGRARCRRRPSSPPCRSG